MLSHTSQLPLRKPRAFFSFTKYCTKYSTGTLSSMWCNIVMLCNLQSNQSFLQVDLKLKFALSHLWFSLYEFRVGHLIVYSVWFTSPEMQVSYHDDFSVLHHSSITFPILTKKFLISKICFTCHAFGYVGYRKHSSTTKEIFYKTQNFYKCLVCTTEFHADLSSNISGSCVLNCSTVSPSKTKHWKSTDFSWTRW